MKKTLLLASGLAIILVIVASIAVWFSIRIGDSESIIEVLDANKRAWTASHDWRVYYHGNDLQQAKRWASEADKIDYSHCPKDFQLAWFDYLQSLHALGDHGYGHAFHAELDAIGAYVTRSRRLAENSEKQLDSIDVQSRYISLQRIAITHGVTFHSN